VTRLILIRHGETEWNVEGRYQGQADPPLNENGIQQAHALANKISSIHLDIIYSSPLKRARQTAEILIEYLEIPLILESRFMEIDQGEWQTKLRSEIESSYPDLFRRWETVPWEVTPPNGEHLTQVQERVINAVKDIINRHPVQSVGILSHRIPIALMKLNFQKLDPDIIRTLELPNTYFEEISVPKSNTPPI
jgi:broad specificity phosphatase PhoE